MRQNAWPLAKDSDISSAPASACPEGSVLSRDGHCLTRFPPSYPPPTILDGHICTSHVDPQCHQGFTFNGNRCVAVPVLLEPSMMSHPKTAYLRLHLDAPTARFWMVVVVYYPEVIVPSPGTALPSCTYNTASLVQKVFAVVSQAWLRMGLWVREVAGTRRERTRPRGSNPRKDAVSPKYNASGRSGSWNPRSSNQRQEVPVPQGSGLYALARQAWHSGACSPPVRNHGANQQSTAVIVQSAIAVHSKHFIIAL